MQMEDVINKKIDILNDLGEEKKQELFSQMEMFELKKLVDLIEEGDKND